MKNENKVKCAAKRALAMTQDMVLEARKVLAPCNKNDTPCGPLSQSECLEIRAGIHVGKFISIKMIAVSRLIELIAYSLHR